ncbi:MAG TPA: PSD1 and planctomycete cytochrome C domain-containing protein [Bryobacteraceae bacterium]|nr:PSD1 and planctomycete cytochrome C domain-containing protein [Bryobacteraceae bacterium]
MRCPTVSLSAVALVLLAQNPLHAQAQTASSPDFFEMKVRPVLAERCYACHASTAMSGLRLDSREAMLKGGSRGASIVPGDPEKSLLVAAIRQTDEKLKMPMGGKLKDSEIEDLVAWIKAGAVWPATAAINPTARSGDKYVIPAERKNFWSLLPLAEPKTPAVKDAHWPKTTIDHFVLARLEKEGMKPARPASRHDLIRRASLDLTGLPPTPEEIAGFEKDPSPDAFAKVVDRLLASPEYGERWGRIWLDVARFGEDDYRSLNPNPRGYHPYPNAYMYRDWVIQAYNDDLPYDQFVREQLAGDLLDAKTRYKAIPATGFLGLGPWYYDNGAVEVTRADERHDRVDVVTRGFLGLTVACARCHDHKYDPIPTTDYYSLAGVFLNTVYHEYPQVPKKVLDEYTRTEEEIEKKQKMLQELQTNLSNQLSESLAFQASNYLQAVYEVVALKRDVDNVVESRKLDYELLQRWIKYAEKPTDKYKYKEEWQAMMKRATASPGAGGRGGRGGGAAGGGADAGGGYGMGGRRGGGGGPNTVSPEVKKLADEFQANIVKVMLARRDLNEENDIIAAKALEGTTKKKRANKPNEFITNDDFCPGCGLRLKIMPEEDTNFWTEIFVRELRDAEDPAAMMAAGGRGGKPGLLLFRGWGLETRTGSQAQQQMASIRTDIEQARKKLEPAFPFAHGVQDSDKPVNLPIAIRGNPENLGPEVPRHFLSLLSKDDPAPFTKGSGRLELADAIVRQPLAMRVIVNRIWKGHFVTGIVETPSNFGLAGERPTDPELLEYLADNFVKNGMSIKKLHREIMLSSVYQLSTENDPANFAKDSGNRLYWRADRKRMDAEQLRDSVMLVAGNLDRGLGGPSEDLNPAMTRRTVYGRVSRYKLDEYLQLFDFPTPSISAEKRFTTTVPLQRLFLMNSDFMQVESEELAKRVAGEPDNRSRIRKAYQLIYGRDPKEEEIKLGIAYLHEEPMKEYEENKNKPPEGGRGGRGGRGGDSTNAPTVTGDAAKPEPAPSAAPDGAGEEAQAAPMGMGMGGMGMMGGMGGRRGGAARPPEVKYDPTPWGRYVKVLLSSSEFLFIN